MRTKVFLLNLLVTLSLILALVAVPVDAQTGGAVLNNSTASSVKRAPTNQVPSTLKPVVTTSLKNDTSPALRDAKAAPTAPTSSTRAVPWLQLPSNRFKMQPLNKGTVIGQNKIGPASMPSTLANFEGVNNLDGVYPPDTNGDIGYNPSNGKRYYMEMINLHYEIWDVSNPATPVSLVGPLPNNSLWSGFGGPCETANDGDPIAMFDEQAHRWVASQFVTPFSAPQSHQCIAISTSADPTGTWYRYDFLSSASLFIDYPHFGVWPDSTYNAYFMTAHEFNNSGTAYEGQAAYAFERAKMLNGQAAQMVLFDLGQVDINFGGQLTADLDGTPAPANTPGYFFELDDTGTTADTLSIWEFRPDWTNTANSTFGLNGQPNTVLSTNNFISFNGGIPQPGTSQQLDSLADRLMHRVAYRNFGSYQSVVLNRTGDDGSGRAGVAWFELRNTGSGWSINQQGFYAPSDGAYRWMAGIAQDVQGNIGLGFSVSDATSLFPTIRYTGRLAGDPLGTLPQGESTIITGSGNQTGSAGRWGDYSMMGVDPEDQCTFWYAQEYIQFSGVANWQTRLASFNFPNCAIGPTGTLAGTVTNASNSNPVAGAQIKATASVTQTGSATSDSTGHYAMPLLVGTYNVSATAYGYQSASVGGVQVISGTTTTQNFALTPVPMHTVSGSVTDATTGWSLYSHITIQGNPFNPPPPANDFWTDPVTGHFSVALATGITYTFNIQSWVPGYSSKSITVGPLTGDLTQNVGLNADLVACNAPGYSQSINGLYENFDSATTPALPANWATVPVTFTGFTTPAWLTNVGTHNPAGVAAHSGPNLAYFNSYDASAGDSSRLYRTTGINMTTLPTTTLSLWMYHETGFNFDDDRVQVQVSLNGGGSWINVGTPISRYDGTTGWAHHTVNLAAFGGQTNLRLGFLGISEFGNDIHIDDVLLGSMNCAAAPGGLVVGNVYDGNTNGALAGATVSNDSGGSTTSKATDDPNVDDSFYTLFSSAGAHALTASMTNYGSDSHTPTAVAGSTIRQDFHLPAGKLSASPTSLQASLGLGQNTVKPLTLNNSGGLAAAFQLLEQNGGFIPRGPQPGRIVYLRDETDGVPTDTIPNGRIKAGLNRPAYRYITNASQATNIIVYADDSEHSPTAVELALQSLGLSYTFYGYDTTGTNLDLFTNALNAGGWDLVIMAEDSWTFIDAHDYDAVQNYIAGGGKAIVQSWGIGYDSIHQNHPLWGLMGGQFAGWITSPSSLYWWQPNNPILNGVPQFTSLNNLGFLAYGGRLTLTGSSDTGLGGFTTGATAGQAGVILRSDNKTIYKGLTDNLNSADLNSNGIPDAAEWWTNAIGYIVNPVVDIPWLSEVPVSGTISSQSNQAINVTFDATGITQPGSYYGQLTVKNDTPYSAAAVPVTMTVTAPPTWGKLTGTVAGLAHCDTGGAPLNKATVFVRGNTGSTWTLSTDSNGVYQLWLDQANSPLTAMYSDSGYLTRTLTNINVTGHLTTTKNVSLRLNVPCVTVNPTSLAATVNLGTSTTTPLTIGNSGAAAATFQLKDTDNGFTPILIGPSVAPLVRTPATLIQGQHFTSGRLGSQTSIGTAPAPHPNDPPWTAIANYPRAIMDNSADALNGKAYSVGGYDGSAILNNAYAYDSSSGSWSAIASMADAREKPAVAFVNGKLYVVGGWDSSGNPDSKLEIYDPDANAWSTGASIPLPLAGATGVALNGQFYVIGGCDAAVCGHTEAYRYDPGSNAWSAIASYPEQTSWEACGPINGLLYCAGGVAVNESQHTYVYDPDANTWTALANMPQTQWAMGYVAAGGKLYISGGVTDNFATVTNAGFVFDPGSNSWAPIANSINTLYRGASTCGFYKIGGSSGGFSPVANAEVFPGLTDCGTVIADAPWLTENPITGTINPSRQQQSTITFNASANSQPGTYLATISTKSNDPVNGNIAVPVTMTVPAPAGWGQVHGRVYSLGYCDSNPGLLAKAEVDIMTSTGVTATLPQDAAGDPWAWWAPAGPVTITVSMPNYVTQSTVVNIAAGQGINQDTSLRWLHNCGSVMPSPINLTIAANKTVRVPIKLVNHGTLAWNWSLSESSSWLSITGATSGSTSPDSFLPGQLTINTTGFVSGGTYTALLNVTHDDNQKPNPLLVQVTVHVP